MNDKSYNFHTVEQYMTRNIVSLHPKDRVSLGIEKLISNRISGAPVVEKETNRLIGIFSEKDAMKVILNSVYYNQPFGLIEEYMSTKLTTIPANLSIVEAIKIFFDNSFRRLPILNEQKELIGILSRADVLKAIKKMEN